MNNITSKNSSIFFYSVCFFAVLIPNLVLSFEFVGLIHDDSAQMWLTGKNSHKSWFGAVQFFNAYREDLLFHLALYVSPVIARLFIVVVYMCGASIALFYLLTNFLYVKRNVALLISTLPFLSPSIWQIPLGINISYVAGDVFFSVLAAILICHYVERKAGLSSNVFKLLGIYLLLVEVQPSSIVTAPILIVLALTWGRAGIVKRSSLVIVSFFSIVSIYFQEKQAARKQTVDLQDLFGNLSAYYKSAANVLSPGFDSLAWQSTFWILTLCGLAFALGCIIKHLRALRLFDRNSKLHSQAELARYSGAAVLLVGFFWSLVPYALVSKGINPMVGTRYYFIWQFFGWTAFSLGLSLLFRFFHEKVIPRQPYNLNGHFGNANQFLFFLIALFFSYSKLLESNPSVKNKNDFIRPFKFVLRAEIPAKTYINDQLLILIKKSNLSGIAHFSNYIANTGYFNYLVYPRVMNFVTFSDPDICGTHFRRRQPELWGRYMLDGFSSSKSLAVFSYDPSEKKLHPKNHMVEIESGENIGRGRFSLYTVKEGEVLYLENFEDKSELQKYALNNNIETESIAYGDAVFSGKCDG